MRVSTPNLFSTSTEIVCRITAKSKNPRSHGTAGDCEHAAQTAGTAAQNIAAESKQPDFEVNSILIRTGRAQPKLVADEVTSLTSRFAPTPATTHPPRTRPGAQPAKKCVPLCGIRL